MHNIPVAALFGDLADVRKIVTLEAHRCEGRRLIYTSFNLAADETSHLLRNKYPTSPRVNWGSELDRDLGRDGVPHPQEHLAARAVLHRHLLTERAPLITDTIFARVADLIERINKGGPAGNTAREPISPVLALHITSFDELGMLRAVAPWLVIITVSATYERPFTSDQPQLKDAKQVSAMPAWPAGWYVGSAAAHEAYERAWRDLMLTRIVELAKDAHRQSGEPEHG